MTRWYRDSLRRFRYGWGTFKVDWALAGPVPWTSAEARESAVVHAGDSVADLTAFTRQVRSGRLPHNPYLVLGQNLQTAVSCGEQIAGTAQQLHVSAPAVRPPHVDGRRAAY